MIAAIADIGLVTFFLASGVMAPADGAPGIVLLLVALAGAVRTGWRPGPPRVRQI